MRKIILILLSCLLLLCSITGCAGTEKQEIDNDLGKTYSFTEQAMGGSLEVLFTVNIKSDGGFTITESNPVKGEITYSGDAYTWRETYFTTGAISGDTLPEAAWFDADGSCVWIIDGEASVYPMKYVASDSSVTDETTADANTSDTIGKIISGLAYADDSDSQVLDIYLPNGTEKFPVIVLFHGGGFKFGDQTMSILEPVIDAGLENGYAVVSADYRKSTEAVFPAALADAKAVVRWVKKNADSYGFDADKIAIWGESAGAYLAVMTALTPQVDALNGDVTECLDEDSGVAALVDFYGPVDFWTMDEDSEEVGISANTGAAGSFESDFIGQPVSQDEEYTRRTWWGTYSDEVPEELYVWIQAGDSDSRVPYLQSVRLGEQLTEILGADRVKYGLISGADHEDDLFYTEQNLSEVFSWLNTVMK